MAQSYTNICNMYDDMGHALNSLQWSLQLKKQLFYPPHPEIAETHNGIGSILGKIGDLCGAAFHHGCALQMFEEVYGTDTPHHDTARAHAGLGRTYVEMGDLELAIPHLAKALDMYLNLHADNQAHLDIVTAYHNLHLAQDRQAARRYLASWH